MPHFYYFRPDRKNELGAAIRAIGDAYGGQVFADDNLITVARNFTFRDDPRFVHAFDSTVVTEQERSLIWRLHTLTWAARHALHIPGDFVECGVFHGFMATVVCKYLDFQNLHKTFWLYDTFAGLPEETSTPQEREREAYYYSIDPEQWLAGVRARLAAFPNARIVKGAVPFTFEQASPSTIAFLHLDMNAARAELMALEKLFDRISPGGIIVLDDYGWLIHRAQTTALREFFASRDHAVLELPTGQGMVVKH